MNDPKQFVEDFLAHYASEYYDPVKAREYYLRTRELKGREPAQSTAKQTPAQKAAAAAKRQADSKAASAQRDAIGYVSKEIRSRQTAELTAGQKAQAAKAEKVRKTAEAAATKINEKLIASLDKLAFSIPDNATPKMRAFLEKQNAKKSGKARQLAGKEREKLSADLQSAVKTARTEYQKSREATRAKYKKALETEKNNIRTQVR